MERLGLFFNTHCVETGGVDNPLKKHCKKGQQSSEVAAGTLPSESAYPFPRPAVCRRPGRQRQTRPPRPRSAEGDEDNAKDKSSARGGFGDAEERHLTLVGPWGDVPGLNLEG